MCVCPWPSLSQHLYTPSPPLPLFISSYPVFPFPTLSLLPTFSSFLSPSVSLYPTSLPSPHFSSSLSTPLYLSASLPQYHPPQKSHIEIGFPATPLPYALVSPMVGCFCSLPRLREEMKGKGDGFRGICREFLNSSATPLPFFQLGQTLLYHRGRQTGTPGPSFSGYLPTHPEVLREV